jgi:dihydrofolate reductase
MIVSLIAAISADGYIAASEDQNSLTWTSKEDTQFFISKTKEIGTLVMGRKTFDTIGKPLKGRRIVVMSRTAGDRLEGENGGSVEYTGESPVDLVTRLASEGVTQLIVCGGATIYSQFLRAGLVEELFLTVEPVFFGGGVPLTSEVGRMDLQFVESSMLGSSSVLLHYRIVSYGRR